MEYKTLNLLPAETFLDPSKFVTDFDSRPIDGSIEKRQANAKAQYAKGIETGKAAKTIFIGADGTWGATMKDGSSLTSYEGIGYHANTADLLKGFLDSGAEVVVYRYPERTRTVIKPRITNAAEEKVS